MNVAKTSATVTSFDNIVEFSFYSRFGLISYPQLLFFNPNRIAVVFFVETVRYCRIRILMSENVLLFCSCYEFAVLIVVAILVRIRIRFVQKRVGFVIVTSL